LKKTEDKSSKKDGEKPKPKNSNGADYEKKREYQVKITEQKISYKETTVRGKQREEPRDAKISISSASSPSRTPSPFLKPHERKDYVPPPQKNQADVKKSANNNRKRSSSASSDEEVDSAKKDLAPRKESQKSVKVEKKDERESRKRPAHDASEPESIASEKSKKRKKKNRDGSVSDDSEKKKKRSKAKKHKKSSKKSKKKDRSDKSSASEEETNVNENLEKKLRERALNSLMKKNKKV
jgi:hypothetical protein